MRDPLAALACVALLAACGGEAHDAPPPVVVPAPPATPVASAVAPPAPAPIAVAIRLADRSVRVGVHARAPVPIDARALKLPPALRAHLDHQRRDDDDVVATAGTAFEARGRAGSCDEDPKCRNAAALHKAADDATARAQAAIKRYQAWAPVAARELEAAVDAPGATADVALAAALFLRTHPAVQAHADMNVWTCRRELSEGDALHPCGEEDPRAAHAFARAAELAPASDARGLLARRGVAQTAHAKAARRALEEARDAAGPAERGDVLADLAVAYASGPEPDWDGAGRALRELRDVREQEARAGAAKPPPGAHPRGRGGAHHGGPGASGAMFGAAGGFGEPELSFSGASAADAARLLVFVESHARRDAACVQAAADLTAREGAVTPAVARLAADAVERSDDSELSKAPAALQTAVLEALATRALYRGDAGGATRWAGRVQPPTDVASRILAAAARYDALPAPGEKADARPRADDLDTALATRAGPERAVASLVRACVEPLAEGMPAAACLRFEVRHAGGPAALEVTSGAGLPSGLAECLRQRGVAVFARTSYDVTAQVGLVPNDHGMGAGGAEDAPPARGEGIGLGSFGTLGHGAGSGTGQGFGAPNPCGDEARR